jgi:hypothetical protein
MATYLSVLLTCVSHVISMTNYLCLHQNMYNGTNDVDMWSSSQNCIGMLMY